MRRVPDVGQIVRSRAGRDQGRFFIIVKVLDEQYVEIADGKLRKMAHPKKKKLRHLVLTARVCGEAVQGKLKGGAQVLDAEIRKNIAAEAGDGYRQDR